MMGGWVYRKVTLLEVALAVMLTMALPALGL